MRLGRICIYQSYVVDLDDDIMVNEAKDALYEDLMSAIKYGEVSGLIHVKEAPEANKGDIPDFLTDTDDEC